MSDFRRKPQIRHMGNGEVYIQGKDYMYVPFFEVGRITETGDAVDIGVKPYAFRADAFSAEDEMNVTLEAKVTDAFKLAAMPTDGKIDLEMVLRKFYIPARRHRKKRIAKKWAKKHGYIEKTISARGTNCAVTTSPEMDTPPEMLHGRMGLVTMSPREKTTIEMEKVEIRVDDRRITWEEYEKIRRNLE